MMVVSFHGTLDKSVNEWMNDLISKTTAMVCGMARHLGRMGGWGGGGRGGGRGGRGVP